MEIRADKREFIVKKDWKDSMKRLIAISLVIVILLSGCSSQFKSVSVAYDIDSDTRNLDPQFATDDTAKLVIMNIFEGLVVEDNSGKIRSGVAEDWEISSDNLTYTFKLRENTLWHQVHSDSPKAHLTAEDFRYGLSRIFNPNTPSPYSEQFSTIKNAKAILAGEKNLSELGIKAVSATELVIELDEADDLFLHKLASTAAMPCSEEFFEETRGRYGLERSLICGNGPFYMSYWETDHRITLTKNAEYKGESLVQISSVELYIDRDDRQSRFLDGKTDIYFTDSAEFAYSLRDEEWNVRDFEKTNWVIEFDLTDDEWGAVPLRQAVGYFIDLRLFGALMDEKPYDEDFGREYSLSTSLFTDETQLDGIDFLRKRGTGYIVGDATSLGAIRHNDALDAFDVDRITSSTLYYPSEGIHERFLTELKNQCVKNGIIINLSGIEPSEYSSFLKSGEYKLAVVPMRPSDNTPKAILNQFKTGTYNNPVYNSILEDANSSNILEDKIEGYIMAEKLLLTDAVVIPLYTEKGYYVISQALEESCIYPVSGLVRFHS